MRRKLWLPMLVPLSLSSAQSAEIVSTPITESSRIYASEEAPEQAAARWDLDVVEWNRYRELMSGMRGAVSHPRLSPIEVLGIHARDADERRYYAERWVQLVYEDTERVLAFNRAYSEAFARLYPDVPLVDTGRTAARSQVNFKPGERWLYFTDTACASCARDLAPLLAALQTSPLSGLDIYLVDTQPGEAGDANARRWAQDNAIPPELVRQRRVTINHANGLLDTLAPGARAPYLLRWAGDSAEPELLGERH